ncbi:hypothetical protein [Bacteroides sp. 224]|uniref:hypothetical protein n=1 Tax=Bacteroides sp. 224 TaxID=2302936 RepID=UPI0013D21C34|nr:hypothetical protein [Bacteroides sp. 224]NDV64473.1 hypothetical protein [Bacteroides sp. 224]
MEEKRKKLSKEELEKIKKEREQEMEREVILMKADEVKEETLIFDMDGQIEFKNEIADLVLEQIDDPEEKFNLYYNVVNRLLKKHLPKGEENKDARELIYEEKNTFLTRGHRKNEKGIRGADGRMAYIPDINELINIIMDWISNKGTMFDLYTKIRDLNISKGYGSPRI